MVCGIVGTTGYKSEEILLMRPGETKEIAGYALTFRGAAPSKGPNYTETIGAFDVTRNGAALRISSRRSASMTRASSRPAKRASTPPGPATSTRCWATSSLTARSPCALLPPARALIWIGTLIMFLGGAISLSDRRLRVGAPRRASRVPPPFRQNDNADAAQTHPLPMARDVVFGAASFGGTALAVTPQEILADKALEVRARDISARPALPRLPEPVDRRFLMRRSLMICACWCVSA